MEQRNKGLSVFLTLYINKTLWCEYKYKAKIGWDYSYINYNWDGVLTIRIYVEEYSNLIAEDEIEDLDFYVFELKLLNVG